jgi:hypothetical protein
MSYRIEINLPRETEERSNLSRISQDSAVRVEGFYFKNQDTATKILTRAEAESSLDTREIEIKLDNIANSEPSQVLSQYAAENSAGIFEASYDHNEGSFEVYSGDLLTRADESFEIIVEAGTNFDGLSEAARSTIYNSINGDGVLQEYLKSKNGQKLEREKISSQDYEAQFRREEQTRADSLEDMQGEKPAMFKKYFEGRGLDYFLMMPQRGPQPKQVLLTSVSLKKYVSLTGKNTVMIKADYVTEQSQKNKIILVNNMTNMSIKEARKLAARCDNIRAKNLESVQR